MFLFPINVSVRPNCPYGFVFFIRVQLAVTFYLCNILLSYAEYRSRSFD